MQSFDEPRTVAERYRRFARDEAAGSSEVLARLALAVADDDRTLALLGPLPRTGQQPNLLFAALRYLGVDVADPSEALRAVHDRPADVLALLTTRRTQTNEAARCAVLLPWVEAAARGRPVALIELGASAGLTLVPDRYAYAYETDAGTVRLGDGLVLPCRADDVLLPSSVPEIVWRAGVDLEPLDASAPDTRRWLQALVWPEHTARAARLDAALDLVAADPPRVVRADFAEGLRQLLPEVPSGAALVVTHSAALIYAEPAVRDEVRSLAAAAGGVRVGAEGFQTLPDLRGLKPVVEAGGAFVVSVDGDAVATADGHGGWVRGL